MQHVFKLTDGLTTADFLTGNLALAVDGYSNTDAADEDGYIWETIRLVNPASYTTDAEMRTAKKNIDHLLERARKWARNQVEITPVWLYWQSEGEEAKHALVVDGTCEIVGSEFDSPLLGAFGIEVLVAVKRWKDWEPETPTGVSTTSFSEGAKWSIGNAAGTTDQRISKLYLYGVDGHPIQKAWLGIRPTHRGSTGFVSIWQAENGFQSNDTTVDSDATASGGQCSHCTFTSTTSLTDRVNIEWQDVAGGNYDDLAGRYLVLARMKVDQVTTQVYVQLRAGLSTAGPILGGAYLDGMNNGASWQLYDLGEVQIPLQGDRGQIGSAGDQLRTFMLSVYAEWLSGAGGLKIDYLQLIPSEHLLLFSDDLTNNVPYVYAYTDEDGRQYGFGLDAAGYNKSINISPHTWQYPMNGGFLVLAVQEQSSHALGRDYNVSLEMYPRWLSYRV